MEDKVDQSNIEQIWVAYSKESQHKLPRAVFMKVISHAKTFAQEITAILADEYRTIALYALELILDCREYRMVDTLLIAPFHNLAKQDQKMLQLSTATKNLHELCYGNKEALASYIDGNIAEPQTVSDQQQGGNNAITEHSLMNYYLYEIRNITRKEIKDTITDLRQAGVKMPLFARDVLAKPSV